ncbi:MAG: MBL fold metallo-hydrolase, partial [Cyanobacteria bacterium NC_groundwater_1444_Ag_S-0.65um_54_12]|nr:MBL fold metallo-hydrolase [Cyanobacteria bacterium NC_groundwater_1444_Ag_S-0.65um_54_12]
IPHHGSRFSSSRAFLQAIKPKLSVISVGSNPFGHPDPGTIRRLLAWGPVYRTDRDGGVLLALDGQRWTVTATSEVAAR